VVEALNSALSAAPILDTDADFYLRLVGLPREDRESLMLEKLLRELRQDPDGLRESVLRRFRSWLRLSREDGALIAASYGRAFDALSPEQQRTLQEAEREVVMNGLSYRDFTRLAESVPWLRAWDAPPLPSRPAAPTPPAPPWLATVAAMRAGA